MESCIVEQNGLNKIFSSYDFDETAVLNEKTPIIMIGSKTESFLTNNQFLLKSWAEKNLDDNANHFPNDESEEKPHTLSTRSRSDSFDHILLGDSQNEDSNSDNNEDDDDDFEFKNDHFRRRRLSSSEDVIEDEPVDKKFEEKIQEARDAARNDVNSKEKGTQETRFKNSLQEKPKPPAINHDIQNMNTTYGNSIPLVYYPQSYLYNQYIPNSYGYFGCLPQYVRSMPSNNQYNPYLMMDNSNFLKPLPPPPSVSPVKNSPKFSLTPVKYEVRKLDSQVPSSQYVSSPSKKRVKTDEVTKELKELNEDESVYDRDNKSDGTLVYIKNIPKSLNNVELMNKNFKKFGLIINIQCDIQNNSAKVQFKSMKDSYKSVQFYNKTNIKFNVFGTDKIIFTTTSKPDFINDDEIKNIPIVKNIPAVEHRVKLASTCKTNINIDEREIASTLTGYLRKLIEEKNNKKSFIDHSVCDQKINKLKSILKEWNQNKDFNKIKLVMSDLNLIL